MFTLIVTIKSLRPPKCDINSTCVSPTTFQYSFLCISLTLASLGLGGTRYILATMGADQLDKPKHQQSFFNWFVFFLYAGWIIGYTLLIYIQTNVSWVLSFAIALVVNVIVVVLFVLGSRIYRKIPPQGSPFISIARVFVVFFRNMKIAEPVNGKDCYLYQSEDSKLTYGEPTKSFRFLNKAALISQGENRVNGTNKTKSWSECTVEEVEDLKKLIKILPLWSSGILLSATIGVIASFTVLVALVMDRQVGSDSRFKIPAGTFGVISLVFTAITSSTLDKFIQPTYTKLTGRRLTYLQRIGIGHVCNILAVIGFALIERKRHKLIQVYHLTTQQNAVAPLSAFWLIFPLAIIGIGEGFSLSPEVALYYQEFPKSLRSTSTAMVSLHIAIGFYMSSTFIDLVGRTSNWLPNDINLGRVDNACWVFAIVASINFSYFLLCAVLYKYNNSDPDLDDVRYASN
ncbi:protein NRT1/ PTR FAMILY 2.7-like [Spinacia oleracea]|uniref:Protein NRT1/ PTR FAMILY 2.7-like n=1 Tax=Spinacia oleracea TaxID=3562 RepID=A0A9R0HUS7_SPIOL|nr:protein NRT1/ PTR FAMILY 2.7-like [Spinacia oleracea]